MSRAPSTSSRAPSASDSLDVLPEPRLGLKPVVRSLRDLDADLCELSYLKSREETAKAACDQQINLAKATFQKKLCTEIAGRDVTFADRRKQLEAAAFEFVDEHPEIFPEGSKTLTLTYGSISIRKQPEGITFGDGITEQSVLDRIESRTGVLTKIADILNGLLGLLPIATFVRIKTEVNKVAIKAAFSAGRLSESELRKLGFVTCGGDEVCSIAPSAYVLRSESAK